MPKIRYSNIDKFTGSGDTLVLSTSPSLVTPSLGVATANSINKVAFTAPATGATITLANNSTLATTGAFSTTFAAQANATFTLPNATGTLALNNQTMNIGTTALAINRTSAELALSGILGFGTDNKATATTHSSAISITTGNATGTTSDSGNISIDVGTATRTKGSILIGAVNALSVSIGANLSVSAAGALNGVSGTFTGALQGSTVTSVGVSYGKAFSGALATLAETATIAWNLNNGDAAQVTLTANRIMGAPTNLKTGNYILIIKQDLTGSRTLTWNAVYKFPGGVPPVLSTAPSAIDIVSFYCDGVNMYGSYVRGMA